MSFVDEARRQLDICNACRYCEGYCAVYPALERRIELEKGDLVQLANLCHDCRACYYACMYAPPHEFALNPPQLLAEVRRESFAELVPGGRSVGRVAPLLAVGAVTATLLAVIGATRGLSVLTTSPVGTASPYVVIPYPALLAIGLGCAFVAVSLFGSGALNYQELIGPRPAGASRLAALARAGHDAATLRWMRSAGVECTYPEELPSPLRRRLHSLLAGGFLLALAATIAAGISEDLAGNPPPYSYLSAPVLLGLVGGVGMLLGGIGLLMLKAVVDPAPGDSETTHADVALTTVLLVLALSGLLTLFTRTTSAYGVLLLIHLDAVFSAFLLAPFTKFAHVVFRVAALVRDEEERQGEGQLP
jgi:citrate/tricarballylate utilization protein